MNPYKRSALPIPIIHYPVNNTTIHNHILSSYKKVESHKEVESHKGVESHKKTFFSIPKYFIRKKISTKQEYNLTSQSSNESIGSL